MLVSLLYLAGSFVCVMFLRLQPFSVQIMYLPTKIIENTVEHGNVRFLSLVSRLSHWNYN